MLNLGFNFNLKPLEKMKKRVIAAILLLTVSIGFVSCEDDDNLLDETTETKLVDPKKVKPPTSG